MIGILHQVFGGIEVNEGDNLRAALDFCQRQRFDLALVDLQLPDGDSYAVLRNLGQTQRKVISIVTAAIGSDGAVVAALSAGPNGYVLKRDPPDLIASQISKIPDSITPCPLQLHGVCLAICAQQGQTRTVGPRSPRARNRL